MALLNIAAILFLSLLGQIEGACKTHDAKWTSGSRIRISQPSPLHPDKVIIDWSSALQNARCVDFYNIYIWKHGQPKERGQKIVLNDKTVSKKEVIIEPCVDYDFAVEFVERDWTHTDQKSSETVRYKTEASPSLVNQDLKNFAVSYALDPIKKHQVVDKVSIKFRKDLLKHANCIKHLEIEGQVDNSPVGGSTQTRGRSIGFSQRARGVGGSSQTGPGYGSVGGSSQTGSGYGNVGGSNQYNPGHGNAGGSNQYNPGHGNVGGSNQYNPGHGTVGGSNQYSPGHGGSSQTGSVGGSSQYSSTNQWGTQYNPGHSSVGGSSQTNPGYGNVGGSSQTNPGYGNVGGSSQTNHGGSWSWNHGQNTILPDNYGNYRNPNCPVGGSSQTGSSNYDPRCYWSRPDYEHDHVHGDHQSMSKPLYNDNGNLNWQNNNNNLNWSQQRRNKRTVSKPTFGANNRVSFKVEPPFLGNFIEAVFPVNPCTPYKFTMKIVTPRNVPLGEIRNLKLPKLSDMYDFHSAPLSSIIDVSSTGSLSLKPTSGVPATCLHDLFEAVDNHMSYLEDDLLFHMNQEWQAHQNTQAWSDRLSSHKRQQLSSDGCQCNATWIAINGTSVSSYKPYMSNYHFEGMFKVLISRKNSR